MKKRKVLLSTFVLLLVFIVILAININVMNAATLFSDNFEDGNASGWSTNSGSWSVVSDGSYAYKQSSTSSTCYTSSGSTSWTNYAVEAKVKPLSFNGSSKTVGVCARFQSTSNFYAAILSNDNKLEIIKKVGGGNTSLASKSFTVQTGIWYQIKLSVNGSSLICSVNGVDELTATDSSFTTGKIGFTMSNVSAEFDDVTVADSTTATVSNTGATTTQIATTPITSITSVPSIQPKNGDIYVAPDGLDSNEGTLSSPTTFTSAISKIAEGNTIYMRGGSYKYSDEIVIARGNNGSASKMKTIAAYLSEKPILDFSSQEYISNDVNERGVKIGGDYWHLKGIQISGAADNGLYLCGDYNIIESCIFYKNRDSGVQISRLNDSDVYADWPANNLILNCDSYENDDPDNHEDADGFACKLTSGPGNVFKGCIAYHNNDDGWDLYTKPATGAIGTVLIDNCIAYENGYLPDSNGNLVDSPGDGNGFKLGGSSMPVNHTIRYSIAFKNRVKGIHYNSNNGSILVESCTSYDNKNGGNFVFSEGTHIFKNNLSFYNLNKSDDLSGTDVESSNCWWYKSSGSSNGKGLIVSESDFVSLTPTISRNSDGSINTGDFLKLASGSDLIGSGINGVNIGAK